MLIGNKWGGYDYISSSTLAGVGVGGVSSVFGRTGAVAAQSGDYTTSQVTEGLNLYWTPTRFDSRLSATTSLPNIVTLSALSLPATQLTGLVTEFANFLRATTTDALAEGSSNLYFNNARARGALTGTYPIGYDSGTGAISIVATSSFGLTTSSFVSPNISQWTNNAGYVTSSFSTSSATYFSTLGLSFSTTSAAYFLSQNRGAAYSTTSADAWLATKIFSQFSTTSADYWKTQNNFFSTTSATVFAAAGLGFSTTSASYYLTQYPQPSFSTSSAAYFSSLGLAFSTTSAAAHLASLDKGFFFSTTSASAFLALNRAQAWATSSADAYEATKIRTSTTTDNAWSGTQTFSIASSTNIFGAGLATCNGSTDKLQWSAGKFSCGIDQTAAGAFATTSADFWKSQRDFFSTTSVAYYLQQNPQPSFSTSSAAYFSSLGLSFSTSSALAFLDANEGNAFSTTSASVFSAAGLAFSTTSTDYWRSVRDLFSTTSASAHLATFDKGYFFSTTSAQNFVHSSTTIPKTYTANTFTGTQTFGNSSTTLGTFGTAWATTICLIGDTCRTTWPSGAAATWGSITGTLSSQADLAAALYGKIGTSSNITNGEIVQATGANTVKSVATSTLFNTAANGVLGLLSGSDWATFSGKENALTFNAPLARSGNTISWTGIATSSALTAGEIAQVTAWNTIKSVATSSLFNIATAGTNGLLSSADWTTFNNKQASLGFTPANSTLTITATYPVTGGGDLSTNRTIGLSFGTTTSNTWAGTQTFSTATTSSLYGAGLYPCTGSNHLQWTGGAFSCAADPAGGFATTSADYWKSQNNFFSTTSAAYYNAQNPAAFSTTSASYFLSVNQGNAFSTTSAAYYLTQFPPASFSTSSAAFFASLGLAHSTTSVAYQLTQPVTLGRATSTGFAITSLTNCDTIDTDASGNLLCGTDASGGGGGGISSSTNPLMATYFVATSTDIASQFSRIQFVDTLGATSSFINIGGRNFLHASSTNGNIGIGFDAGTNFASSTVFGNVAIGYQALQIASSSPANVAIGYQALQGSGTGQFSSIGKNVAVGAWALASSTTGDTNVAIGYESLKLNKSGTKNTAIGYRALATITANSSNVAIGNQAGEISTGSQNVFIGFDAAMPELSGGNNVYIGSNVRANNGQTSTNRNVAIGDSAGFNLTTGSNNSSLLGYRSGYSATASANNQLFGYQSGYNLSTGYDNLILGQTQNIGGNNLTIGGGNILIGYNPLTESTSSKLRLSIGNSIFGVLPATTSSTSLVNPINNSLGIGTSTPWAKFTIQTNNGDSFTNLFIVASSTASATSTLFSIDNTGLASTTKFAGAGLYDCQGTTKKLTYSSTTNLFQCETDQTGVGGGSASSTLFTDYNTFTGWNTFANSTTTGSSYLGTVLGGVWNGTAIADSYISSAATWNAKQDALGFTPANSTLTITPTYPLTGGGNLSSNRTLALAFGTTTANTWVDGQAFGKLTLTTGSSTAFEVTGNLFVNDTTIADATTTTIYSTTASSSALFALNGSITRAAFASATTTGIHYFGNYIGIGTTTPRAAIAASTTASTVIPMMISHIISGVSYIVSMIDAAGHQIYGGKAPTVSACGGSPAIQTPSNDNTGMVKTGASMQSCLITFATAYTGAAPNCFVSLNKNIATTTVLTASTTPSTLLITASATGSISGQFVSWLCVGRQ
ncbi:hypothetical protein RPYSC3_47990 [Rhodopseudomonas palustris]|nr:hypothetical protein RPYSC3_47990 [Rhodopseudomonas palustris]